MWTAFAGPLLKITDSPAKMHGLANRQSAAFRELAKSPWCMLAKTRGFCWILACYAVCLLTWAGGVVAGSTGAEAGAERGAGVVSAAVYVQVRDVHAVQPGARAGAAGHARDRGVLPGGLAVQMWQQALHALTCSVPDLTKRHARSYEMLDHHHHLHRHHTWRRKIIMGYYY